MEEIKQLYKTNDYFSNIDTNLIIENGKLYAQKCKEVIIPLSNLQGIFPRISEKYPLISILQGYMFKLINDGFGLNTDYLINAINLFKREFGNILEEKKITNINEKQNDNKILNEDD